MRNADEMFDNFLKVSDEKIQTENEKKINESSLEFF